MFFFNKNQNDFSLIPYPNFKKNETEPAQVLTSIKSLTLIGKNSIFDNDIETFDKVHSITFYGSEYFNFPEDSKLKIYTIGRAGYLFVDTKGDAFASRSFSLLNDFYSVSGESLLSLFRQYEPTIRVKAVSINNHFSNATINQESISPIKNELYDLDFNLSKSRFSFEMVVDSDSIKIDDHHFYKSYTGNAVNIGQFEQIIIQEKEKYPDYFPQMNINKWVVFTNLINDNPREILVPNVLLDFEYDNMIQNAKKVGKTTISHSNLSTHGYIVDIEINISPQYSSPTATKLTLRPA